jgi:hypothetical protein
MQGLRAKLIEHVPSPEGTQADVVLIEPNGDEHPVRCLCRRDGTTDIGGDGQMLAFLNRKYGEQSVCSMARQITLG